jgi:lipoprotein-anchoring transpeptidase ErfK/SrfK
MRFRRVFVLLPVFTGLLSLAGPAQSATPGPVLVDSAVLFTGVYSGTLAPIAARLGTSMQAVLSAHKLYNPGVILTGLRLVRPGGTPSPTAPPTLGKWIDVDIGSQTTTAYQGSAPLKIVLVSTGTEGRLTPTGSFKVYRQVPSQTLSGGTGADRYYYPGVPWIMYFSGDIGFHGTYWHNNFGVPMSHGCVNLSVEDAKWFYSWGAVGTPVVVHM